MEVPDIAGLQYGALFILLVVLVFIGRSAWKYIESAQIREENRDQWYKSMVDQSREEGEKRTDAWVAMVEKLAEERQQGRERMAVELAGFSDALTGVCQAQAETAATMAKLCKAQERSEERSQERHAELLKAMRASNGE